MLRRIENINETVENFDVAGLIEELFEWEQELEYEDTSDIEDRIRIDVRRNDIERFYDLVLSMC